MSEYKLSVSKRMLLRLNSKLVPSDVTKCTQEQIDEYNRADFSSPANRACYRIVYRGRRSGIKEKTYVIPTGNGAVTGYLFSKKNSPSNSLIVYFHDGGWMLGNMNKTKAMCRNICHKTGAKVIAVDFRLAPVFKFPVPVEDCYSALVWAAAGTRYWCVDESRLFVMGNCSGGTLAAAVCRMARDRKGPAIAGQILIDPITDCRMRTPSFEKFKETPTITTKQIGFYIDNYRKEQKDILDPLFSPLLAQDNTRLPDALIVSAQLDPLHDDGMLYAQSLVESGSSSKFLTANGEFHGFLSYARGEAWHSTMSLISHFVNGVALEDLRPEGHSLS